MKMMYLKDISKLKIYIIEAHTKSKSKTDINDILKKYDEAIKRNAKLSIYLQYFLHKYDLNCDIFYYFYKKDK